MERSDGQRPQAQGSEFGFERRFYGGDAGRTPARRASGALGHDLRRRRLVGVPGAADRVDEHVQVGDRR
ncbi:hypothetical protein E4P41_16015 [Geodermatophilus sp. DF01-2]|uniref:hypothetical protein n=1 Tax=Geodermatophilus sp. DF01-2 TaxID=2559610 RepID=UPI0010744F0D|nr:hypothetical protein [Geodermatophilus sp. DF01_2]TFV56260.1 hypothetical protein E4P41_16015 [Geodermatophilus sp. DF01_2]